MNKSKLHKIIDEPFVQNTYLIEFPDKGAIVIDPGFNLKEIKKLLTKEKLKLKYILITHYHFDHINGVNELVEEFNVKAYISEHDLPFATTDTLAVPFGFKPVIIKKENLTPLKELDDSSIEITSINVPGHSRGSTVYFIDNNIFTGDFLFSNSIGRMDLPGSEPDKMKISLAKVFDWNKESMIQPGHGPSIKVDKLIKNNPYMKGNNYE